MILLFNFFVQGSFPCLPLHSSIQPVQNYIRKCTWFTLVCHPMSSPYVIMSHQSILCGRHWSEYRLCIYVQQPSLPQTQPLVPESPLHTFTFVSKSSYAAPPPPPPSSPIPSLVRPVCTACGLFSPKGLTIGICWTIMAQLWLLRNLFYSVDTWTQPIFMDIAIGSIE